MPQMEKYNIFSEVFLSQTSLGSFYKVGSLLVNHLFRDY